jgi:hypothetical protein
MWLKVKSSKIGTKQCVDSPLKKKFENLKNHHGKNIYIYKVIILSKLQLTFFHENSSNSKVLLHVKTF